MFRKTGIVTHFRLVNSSAIRKSLQFRMKTNSAVLASPPFTSGSTTLKKALQLDDPSTMAASSSSRGTSSKKLFISQTTNGNVTTP